jgi:hypothetical protein
MLEAGLGFSALAIGIPVVGVGASVRKVRSNQWQGFGVFFEGAQAAPAGGRV